MITQVPDGPFFQWKIICVICSNKMSFAVECHPPIKQIIAREKWLWFRLPAHPLEACCPKCIDQLTSELSDLKIAEQMEI